MMATMTLSVSAKPGDKQQKKEKVSAVLTDSTSKNSVTFVSDTLLNDTVAGTESWGDSDNDDHCHQMDQVYPSLSQCEQ